MITEADLDCGVVVHADPDALEKAGGWYKCPKQHRVRGDHFFLCIGADDEQGTWLPLYSKPGRDGKRALLSINGRSGHPTWTSGTFYYHHDQIWVAPHAAMVLAAQAGGDLSDGHNQLADEYIPNVDPGDLAGAATPSSPPPFSGGPGSNGAGKDGGSAA